MQTNEDATLYVTFGAILDSNILEFTPEVLCLENSAKIMDTSMIGPEITKNTSCIKRPEIQCNTANYVLVLVPGLSTGPSRGVYECILKIGIAGLKAR